MEDNKQAATRIMKLLEEKEAERNSLENGSPRGCCGAGASASLALFGDICTSRRLASVHPALMPECKGYSLTDS